MKIKLVLYLLFVSASAYADGVVVNTTITLGRKSQNCNGFGVCTMEVATNQLPAGGISGMITINDSNGLIVLSLNANDLRTVSPDMISLFENKSSVKFEEEFTVSNEMKSALGISRPLNIPMGNFSVSSKDGFFVIEIPIL